MNSPQVTSSWSGKLGSRLSLLAVALLAAVILLTRAFAIDIGESVTRNTVRLSLAWYAVALCLMMSLKKGDWNAITHSGEIARWCWTWGLLCFLVHLVMAFHYYHDWSHSHAFEHTRSVSGVGEGLYVSYLFTVLWIVDVATWWLRPGQYAARPVVVDRVLHGFMLFVVFNSMVVFENGLIRWSGLAMFAALGIVWRFTRSNARKPCG